MPEFAEFCNRPINTACSWRRSIGYYCAKGWSKLYVRNDVNSSVIVWFSWKHVLFFTLYSLAIYLAYHKLGLKFIAVPFLPVGTIGTAVAFYVGFKNNASYERLWEGRKIWSAITSLSRAFAVIVMALPETETTVKHDLIRRQISWCNMLRVQLRSTSATRNSHKVAPEVQLIKNIYGDSRFSETVDDYIENSIEPTDRPVLKGSPNPALRLMELQSRDVACLGSDKPNETHMVEKLLETIVECLKEQGSAERLKSFPFPRQYAYFSGVFVWIFLLLLPFGLIDELAKASVTGLDWMVVPFYALIAWMFITMEQVGDSSEDPFEKGLNDVPLSSICRELEIELLQMIGSEPLPEPIKPVADILM